MPKLLLTKREPTISPAWGPEILEEKTVEIPDASAASISQGVEEYIGYNLGPYVFGGGYVIFTNSSTRAFIDSRTEYRIHWKVL
jgi:hypothetical protein